jgi:HSP20 family protein
MLSWYYDSRRSNVNDILDVFKSLEDLDFNKPIQKSSNKVDEQGIKIEMPGVKSSDVELVVEGKLLKVFAKSRHGKEYSYSYSLRSSVDESAITAKLEDGLLEISLPKKPETSARKIELK